MRPEREHKKKAINVDQTVRYLNHAFGKAQSKAISQTGNKNVKGTPLYKFQVEFCYLINEIQRGPSYIAPKKISEANDLIEALESYTAPGK